MAPPNAGVESRVREDLAWDDFALSPGDMARIDRPDRAERRRTGPRPASA